MIDFRQVLAEKRALVWPVIDRYLNQMVDFPAYCLVPSTYTDLLGYHLKLSRDYPERQGKYLRPALVLLTASALGFPEEKALQTAAAMQLSEEWILIHDDVEDDSVQRRGRPALHRLYGKELAVNAGDGLQVLMWKVLQDNLQELGVVLGVRIQEEFYQMLKRTVFGQTVELKWAGEGSLELTDADILLVSEGKTGYYTFSGPMRLGAILAGVSGPQLADLYLFGKKLGQSFQVVDDLLDLTSDFAGLKQQGNDIYEGKRTVMLAHLLRTAAATDRQKLVQIMAKTREEKTSQEVFWVIEQMKKRGSLEYGKKLAAGLAEEARHIFQQKLSFLKNQPARDQLQAGIDFVINREH